MKSKFYTIHLITDPNKKPFVISIKSKLAWILTLIIITTIAVILVGVYILLPKALNYDSLLAQNEILIKDRLKIIQILSDYNQIKQMDQYIRTVLGTDLNIVHNDSLEVAEAVRDDGTVGVSYLENIPIYPPVNGFVTQGFANNKIIPEDNHYGIDIAAPEGEPIKASASGVVVFSNWTYHYGYTIILYHSGDYFTVYGHNQRNIVREHQYVERGDVIGYVGNTGISEGPHLHFEIWRSGKPINPQEIIYSYKKNDVSIKRIAR